jgi:CMP-N,N'-diacetyllegionaminic acid synthase
MSIVAIIPARLGSKGIPHKNIKLLGGKPLIEYTFLTAKKSKIFDRIILTTESSKISKIAKKIGIDVPFMRPGELALDETPMIDVIKHSINNLTINKKRPKYYCILQPTSPFRDIDELKKAYVYFTKNKCDSVVSVEKVPEHYSPFFTMKINKNKLEHYLPKGINISRRQDVKQAYIRSGCFYFAKTSILIKNNSIYGKVSRPWIVDNSNLVNLDNKEDWQRAVKLIKRKNKV